MDDRRLHNFLARPQFDGVDLATVADVGSDAGGPDLGMRSWEAAWANREYATLDILALGDSITEGYNVTVQQRRWLEVLVKDLAGSFGGGYGVYIPACGAGGTWVDGASPWTYSGASQDVSFWGLGLRSAFTDNIAEYIEHEPMFCDRVIVSYLKTTVGASFEVIIDGVVVTTIDTIHGSLTFGGNLWESGNLGLANHTVRIRQSTGGIVVLEGIMFETAARPKGVRIWDGSQAGMSLQNFISPTTSGTDNTWDDIIPNIDPHLVIIALGYNDASVGGGSRTPEQVAGYFEDLYDKIVGRTDSTYEPSFLFISEWAMTDTYAVEVEAKALELGVGFLNLDARDVDLTRLAPDTIHPEDAGHRWWADRFMEKLVPSAQATQNVLKSSVPVAFTVAVGDETTAITTGTAKVTFRMPFAMNLTAVRASLSTVSSSGIPTFDINEGGTTILPTKLTIDASEKTSVTAATPVVISDVVLAEDAEITIDIDVAGTGAKGPKITFIGTRSV